MGKQNKTKRYIWGGQQSRNKQKQLRLALALACCSCALLWTTPIQAQNLTKVGVDLTDGQIYVVKQGETITVSADNRQALVEEDNSATAYGVQLGSGSATIQGSQIPITAQAWGGTATSDGANAYAYGLDADGNNSTIKVNGNAVISVEATGGTAMGENTSANATARGLSAHDGSTITVDGDAVISVEATGGTAMGENASAGVTAHGFFANGGSTITVDGDAIISMGGKGGTANTSMYSDASGLLANDGRRDHQHRG